MTPTKITDLLADRPAAVLFDSRIDFCHQTNSSIQGGHDVLICVRPSFSAKAAPTNKAWLDRSTLTRDVKVTSASADEISGDIDVNSGDTSIKGSFKAKILKRR